MPNSCWLTSCRPRSHALSIATVSAALLLLLGTAHSAVASGPVYVFPVPGGRVASPYTQITFRGVPVSQLGRITVTGSRSGSHSGRLLGDTDGRGGSFVPARPFATGERVTVLAGVPIVGGTGATYQFITAKPAPSSTAVAPLPTAPRVRGDIQRYASRPDLQPPAVKVLKRSSAAAAGDLFLGSQNGPVQNGPMLLDPAGRLVWFKASKPGTFATDFRVQSLFGANVLTWWQGKVNAGVGNGEDLVYNTSYRQMYALHAGNGLGSDLHEFQLTPQGTALLTSYYPVYWNARSVHLSSNSIVLDSVVQEIDVKTGLVLFQWDSLDHVPLSDSYANRPPSAKVPWDYFHVNSVQQDVDGNLISSARNVSAGYKLDHRTGSVLWILGGRRSSFRLGSGAAFSWQHDIRSRSANLVTVFDDGAGDRVNRHQSRGLTLALDFTRRTATVAASYQHAPQLLSFYEGNMQLLDGGDLFLGWGQQPYFTEYNPAGAVVFDGRFVDANSSYRAYRYPWSGTPYTRPAVAARNSGRQTTVYASWNGATDVASWRALGGPSPSALKPVGATPSQGFESRVTLASQRYVAVQALDAGGRVMAQSRTVSAH